MRTRLVLGVALALTAAGVLVAISTSQTRIAGTNRVRTAGFDVTVPAGRTACQPATWLPGDAAAATLLVGTYGHPTPPLTLRFAGSGGTLVAQGRLPSGLREGLLTVPFERTVRSLHVTTTACVHNGGGSTIVLGGDIATTASGARVGHGAPQGVVSYTYLRPGHPSWWPLIGGVARRFGFGKASLLGSWTLWASAVVLLGLWVAVVRLLLRELPR